MPLVDANVILRYLLNDHPVMSNKAREIILAGAETTPEISFDSSGSKGTAALLSSPADRDVLQLS